MNNKSYQLALQAAVSQKFKGKRTVRSRAVPQYPDSAEREFQRITNGYMRLLNKTVKDHVPAIMGAYKKERHGDSRFDDFRDLEGELRHEFQKIAEDLEQRLSEYDLESLVRKIAGMTQRSSLREWKRVCKSTLGIDLMEDYYSGEFYEDAIRRWVDENVLKIRSIPQETLGGMRDTILAGFRKGQTIREISKLIQDEYSTSKRDAQLLARDQIATLNSQVSKLQQQDTGCTKYRWSTSRDSRVRECHKALDGQVINWDDPPEMWYTTKKAGVVLTGRRCHPGEDYCCRCVAIPVFDLDTLNAPVNLGKKDSADGTG